MFIEIEDLKQEPLHVSHVYEAGALRPVREDVTLGESVSVEFTLSHKELELQVDGTVKTAVVYKCSRCLREFSRPLATSYSLFYLPQPKGVRADEEIALKYEDMAISFYDGIRFEVDQMVVEQIELAMPMKFVCRDDCRGLCYVCGVDLNEKTCGCRKDEPDSRLAALLEFRKKSNKE